MKNFFRLLVIISVFQLLSFSVFAQGPLTPPGPPAATMRSLDQIEARTPIPASTSTVNIGLPGTYVLTGNITVASGDGVDIGASNVTLDLNGFTISSTSSSASGNGIFLNNVQNVTIRNGHIAGGVTFNGTSFSSGPGFLSGIIYVFPGSNPVNIHVSDVSVSGVTQTGIELGAEYSNVVDHCVIRTVGGQGIHCGVADNCSAYNCGSNAINSVTAISCYGVSVASLSGIDSYTAVNCYGVSNTGDGVNSLTATDCYGVSTSGIGIVADSVKNCFASSNNSYGISANMVENSQASSPATAINATNVYNSFGNSTGGFGISCSNALNSYGSTSGSGTGLYATYMATNCYGTSTNGQGLYSYNATNCSGVGATTALRAFNTAVGCSGYATGSGNGLWTYIALACYGQSPNGNGLLATVANSSGGFCTNNISSGLVTTIAVSCVGSSMSYTYHYNMPP